MKSVYTLLLGLAFAATAVAQDQDKDALKKDLLREVEKRLKTEDDKLLKEIEKLIEEELKGGKAPQAAPKAAPKPEPKAEAPKRKARGYLGVRLIELSDDEKKDLGIKSGIKVGETIPGGPAAKAGLKIDDVILTLDGRAIDSTQDLAPIMQSSAPGTTMKVEYLRDGKKSTSNLVLGVHPQDAPAPQADPAPAPAPKEQGKGEEDLRERVKKFLQKKEAPQQDEPKPKGKAKPAPDEGGGPDDFFALDEEMFEQFREMFEKFGVDPEQFFEKGKDGKYRLNDQLKEMFKGFNFDKFKDFLPKTEEPEEEPAPRKAEPKKAEPRKAEPKKAEAPKAPRPWLGIQPEDLPDELRAQLDLADGEGLLVTDVLSGSPAEKAGLKKNDILTKIDGKPVKGEEALAKFMSSAKAGQEAVLTVLRKSKEQTFKVTIGEKRD